MNELSRTDRGEGVEEGGGDGGVDKGFETKTGEEKQVVKRKTVKENAAGNLKGTLNGKSVNGSKSFGRFVPIDEGVEALRYADYEETKEVLRTMPVNLKMLNIIVAMIQYDEGNPEDRKEKAEIGRLLLDNLFTNGSIRIQENKDYIDVIKLLPKELLKDYKNRYKRKFGDMPAFQEERLQEHLEEEEG